MKNKINIFLIVFLLFAGIFALKTAVKSPRLYRKSEFIMGTYVTIQAEGKRKRVLKAMERAFREVAAVGEKFTVFGQESPVYEFNENSVSIEDSGIIELVKKSLKISRESGGAFDITIKPLVELWGFYEGEPRLPAREEITETLKIVNYRLLETEGWRLTKKDNRVEIDFGGIAKGYALTKAADSLRDSGVESALIDAGGDIYALGTREGNPWKIGIRNPRGEGTVGIIKATDKAVVTSGDYENFFISDGKRYHHIINPATGYPPRDMVSVTVMADNAEIADAWATALSVIGRERGLKLLEKQPGIEVVMIDESGKIYHTPGAGEFLTLRKN